MDFYSDSKFGTFGEEDFNDILKQDVFAPVSASSICSSLDNGLGGTDSLEPDWMNTLFDERVILNDKMMSETVFTPPITNEHSYSSYTTSGVHADSEGVATIVSDPAKIKVEPVDGSMSCDDGSEVDDDDGMFEDTLTKKGAPSINVHSIKREPSDSLTITQPKKVFPVAVTNVSTDRHSHLQSQPQARLLHTGTKSAIILTNAAGQPLSQQINQTLNLGHSNGISTCIATTSTANTTTYYKTAEQQSLIIKPKFTVKVEPESDYDYDVSVDSPGRPGMPPTPPSSTNNSDSEGGYSPRSAPSSPIRLASTSHIRMQTSTYKSQPYTQPLFTNPIPQSGVLILSEEEKRTLITEGYPVPSKLPLNKQEEKNLKKIRRKIKNKISAQESRRKKKEYVETLEKRMESYSMENCDLKKRVDTLESDNRTLLGQLQKLQALINGKVTKAMTPKQGSTCLMVLVLCFAVMFGTFTPESLSLGSLSFGGGGHSSVDQALGSRMSGDQSGPKDPYNTPNMRSRVLLSVMEDSLGDDTELEFGVHSFQDLLRWNCQDQHILDLLDGQGSLALHTDSEEALVVGADSLDRVVPDSNDTQSEPWLEGVEEMRVVSSSHQLNIVAVGTTHINATVA